MRSLYSDISSRIIASLEPNKSSANCLANSVLPTPVGPTKRKEPIGRLPSSKPARFRRIARATAATASSCPMTWLFKRLLIPLSLSKSLVPMLETGIPVKRSTDSAISLTVAVTFWLWLCCSICFCNVSIRVFAAKAFSKSSLATAFSCLSFCLAISVSSVFKSVTGCCAAK